MKKDQMMKNTHVTHIEINIELDAAVDHAWQSLVHEISIWWNKDLYMNTKTKSFVLEAWPGGRMYEDYGNNEGLLWGDVVVLDSPHHLELKTHLTPQYGGPAFSFLKLTLSENKPGTLLTLSDTSIGVLSNKTVKELTEGWQHIFGSVFKTYVEK